MRVKINKIAVLLFSIALIFTGCKKWIDPSLNNDPNNPLDVPISMILPSVEVSTAYDLGGNTAVRTTNIWMQFFDGVDRQSLAEAQYNLTSADVNNLWVSVYTADMMNTLTMIKKAKEIESPNWSGIGRVLLALQLGTMTNLYGDMPYSDAFQGQSNNLQPKYDTQEEIYNAILAQLDSAITDLANTDNKVAVTADLIYGGDLTKWTKAAYALKARYLLDLGKYDDALAAANMSFTDVADNFEMPFMTDETASSPLYQFMRDRGDIRIASTFYDMLNATSDPRLSEYCDGDHGSVPGSQDESAADPGDYCAAPDASVVFSNLAEVDFIKSECLLRKQTAADSAAAFTAFQDGVSASLKRVTGSDNPAFVASLVPAVSNLSLDKIIKQKYIAMYATVVPYDDWRRTGYPALNSVSGAISATPVRFPYPQSEIEYNSNTPRGVTKQDALWVFGGSK